MSFVAIQRQTDKNNFSINPREDFGVEIYPFTGLLLPNPEA
jgi:hypothetical protein